MKEILVYFSVFFTATLLAGDLAWSPESIEANISNDLKIYNGVFKFENTSGKEITFLKVKGSCGCTTVDLDKKTYKPGEIGEISFEVKLSRKSNVISKKIFVDTDEAKGYEYLLKFKLIKPEIEQKKNVLIKESVPLTIQTLCPFLETPIDKKLYYDFREVRIYTCCAPCLIKTKDNPSLAIKNLARMGECPVLIPSLNKQDPTKNKAE